MLRYGENPHQRAALYRHWRPGLAHAEQLHGKEMSYNNYVDTDAAWRAAHDYADPCVAIIKHANPCGIAVGADIAAAHRKAHACDPVSAFGGVIAANREVDLTMAEQIAEVFTEVVVAPSFTDDALGRADREEEHPAAAAARRHRARTRSEFAADQRRAAAADRRPASTPPATTRPPGPWPPASRWTPPGWTTWCSPGGACRAVQAATRSCSPTTGRRSASAWARSTGSTPPGSRSPGRGTGPRGSVAASDAFFPFADGLQVLLDAGVRAVVQPGGSVRDDEVIAAAAAAGVTLYLTGTRHFAH